MVFRVIYFLALFLLLSACVSTGCPPLQELNILGWNKAGDRIVLRYRNLKRDKAIGEAIGEYNEYLYSYDLKTQRLTKHLDLKGFKYAYGYFDRHLDRLVFATQTNPPQMHTLSFEGQEETLMKDIQPPDSFFKLSDKSFQISADQSYAVFGSELLYNFETQQWMLLKVKGLDTLLARVYLPQNKETELIYGVYQESDPEQEEKIKQGIDPESIYHHALYSLDPNFGELQEKFHIKTSNSIDTYDTGHTAMYPISWRNSLEVDYYQVEREDNSVSIKKLKQNSQMVLEEQKIEIYKNVYNGAYKVAGKMFNSLQRNMYYQNIDFQNMQISYLEGIGPGKAALTVSSLSGDNEKNLLNIEDAFPKGGRDLICSLGSVP